MTAVRRLLACTAAAAAIAALAATALIVPQGHAGDIIKDWNTAKIPPAPEVKPVTLDGRTTAVLFLDYMKAGWELCAGDHLAGGGPEVVTEKVTLTKTGMIKFN